MSSEYPSFFYSDKEYIILPGKEFLKSELINRINSLGYYPIKSDQPKYFYSKLYDEIIKEERNKILLLKKLEKDTNLYYEKNPNKLRKIPNGFVNNIRNIHFGDNEYSFEKIAHLQNGDLNIKGKNMKFLKNISEENKYKHPFINFINKEIKKFNDKYEIEKKKQSKRLNSSTSNIHDLNEYKKDKDKTNIHIRYSTSYTKNTLNMPKIFTEKQNFIPAHLLTNNNDINNKNIINDINEFNSFNEINNSSRKTNFTDNTNSSHFNYGNYQRQNRFFLSPPYVDTISNNINRNREEINSYNPLRSSFIYNSSNYSNNYSNNYPNNYSNNNNSDEKNIFMRLYNYFNNHIPDVSCNNYCNYDNFFSKLNNDLIRNIYILFLGLIVFLYFTRRDNKTGDKIKETVKTIVNPMEIIRSIFRFIFSLTKKIFKKLILDNILIILILGAIFFVIYLAKLKFDFEKLCKNIIDDIKNDLKASRRDKKGYKRIPERDMIKKYSEKYGINYAKFEKKYFPILEKMRKKDSLLKITQDKDEKGRIVYYWELNE